ncbi:CCA tRNA nucleotidyltransferase [Pseudooceanicola sp. CBS1P-1]|uniref:CCA tRNA nucleotidyltransferase n=1 Tax=Pseudooceanicola albus TaxID=2692189 RepID=A0A6L7FZ64_9RHOB|nr:MULTISPECIES: CCA tRNA nucleotidyltransferase [Pseudooceanicola]MBT9383864.1 CCA tRNA nucleotidyltransferase [Pseudooceanicola endophyticus]MXN16722.1 CCA tRNA nucleotidyltransferase [Pseudooceanicola albus]
MTRLSGDWLEAPATRAVCAALRAGGHQAWFVGGCVRDALLGIPVGDIDICTDARPDTVQALAEAAGLKQIPTGIDHGTITIVSGGVPHEVTTFRRDVETNGRHAVVAFADTMDEDARRRDFTMNALYASPEGAVRDPLGQGLADLAARRLRFIGDAETRIREDYLRTLRYFRFHARFADPQGGFDPEALAAIAATLDGLETLSAERVGAELTKLLCVTDPAPALACMGQVGVLGRLLPGAEAKALAPLVHFEQATGTTPDWRCRLAALGGGDVGQALRLSKKDAATVALLRDAVGAMSGPAELGYRHGPVLAMQVILLRAALLEMPPPPDAQARASFGAAQVFPVKAGDLPATVTGAEIGRTLRSLESRWISSDFTLDRAGLLGEH